MADSDDTDAPSPQDTGDVADAGSVDDVDDADNADDVADVGSVDDIADTDEVDEVDEERARLVSLLRRLHAVLGLALLPAYLLYHLWEHWSALSSVDVWIERVEAGPTGPVAAIFIALPIVIYGCIGLGLELAGKSATGGPDDPQAALRPVRMVTGGLLLVFLLYHLLHVGFIAPGPHQTIRAAFGRLWHDLGQPLPLAVYVFGVSGVCLHVALGLSRAITAATAALPRLRPWALLASGGAAAVVWLMFMELIALFAVGEGLWPG